MITARASCLLLTFTMATVVVPLWAGLADDGEPPADILLLVQSELDFLPATKRVVTLQFDKVRPASVLQTLRKESGLTIEVEGTLSDKPLLSASFRDATVGDVLKWFAEQLTMTFRADPPNRLRIIAEAPRG